jgi:hypothetical protein
MHFSEISLFQKSRRSCIFKCKSFILFVFWGAAERRWTRTMKEESNMPVTAKKKAVKKKAKKATKKKAAKKKKKK